MKTGNSNDKQQKKRNRSKNNKNNKNQQQKVNATNTAAQENGTDHDIEMTTMMKSEEQLQHSDLATVEQQVALTSGNSIESFKRNSDSIEQQQDLKQSIKEQKGSQQNNARSEMSEGKSTDKKLSILEPVQSSMESVEASKQKTKERESGQQQSKKNVSATTGKKKQRNKAKKSTNQESVLHAVQMKEVRVELMKTVTDTNITSKRQNTDQPQVPKKKAKKSTTKLAPPVTSLPANIGARDSQTSDDALFKVPQLQPVISRSRNIARGPVIDGRGNLLSLQEFERPPMSLQENIGNMKIDSVSGASLGAVCTSNSREEGRKTFQWMIKPESESSFFRDYWEKQPLLIKRQDKNYYKNIFSTSDLDTMLHQERVLFTKNLDITSYTDGRRETHNPVGRAHPSVVWDYYSNGCSVRLLNPQTFHRRTWKLLSNLQEYFNAFCGANVYLTPPGTQGFAPHWDDIEAFILQLEGKKHWKIYRPRCEEEELPEVSSGNLDEKEVGEPILEVDLEAGDLLYFPRGFIHQGNTEDGVHSLHMTVSTYQRVSWAHYLQKLLPRALELAAAEDVEFRRGLPLHYLQTMGVVNSDLETPGRTGFLSKVKELMERLMLYAPFDAAVDQFGANLMHDSLPPLLTAEEQTCSVHNGGERWNPQTNSVDNRVELAPDTHIRLIRANVLRVVAEEDGVKVYHCLENTREYHAQEPQYFEMSHEHAPVVEALVHAYPGYIAIENLPLDDEVEKMTVAQGLWERGLVVTALPLPSIGDDDDADD